MLLFLCTEQDVSRERLGLAESIGKLTDVACLDRQYPSIEDVLRYADRRGLSPRLLIQPDAPQAYLPEGLESSPVPTACLQIDTFSGTPARVRLSMLFDLVVVYHPSTVSAFLRAGHPDVELFSHAVRAQFFDERARPERFDLAMVGRLDGADYAYRRDCIYALQSQEYSMNDVNRHYNYGEMAEVYKSARIGLNISRNSHLRDANLRCFEVMAGGALLITPCPSELADLGFEEGEHYVSFRSVEDVRRQVAFYLKHEEERRGIAQRGRAKVLTEHTYDVQACRLLERVEAGIPMRAPGRSMTEGEVASSYVHYYGRRGRVDEALRFLRKQRQAGGGPFLNSCWAAARATIRGWQRALLN